MLSTDPEWAPATATGECKGKKTHLDIGVWRAVRGNCCSSDLAQVNPWAQHPQVLSSELELHPGPARPQPCFLVYIWILKSPASAPAHLEWPSKNYSRKSNSNFLQSLFASRRKKTEISHSMRGKWELKLQRSLFTCNCKDLLSRVSQCQNSFIHRGATSPWACENSPTVTHI